LDGHHLIYSYLLAHEYYYKSSIQKNPCESDKEKIQFEFDFLLVKVTKIFFFPLTFVILTRRFFIETIKIFFSLQVTINKFA